MPQEEYRLVPIEQCIVVEESNSRQSGLGDLTELTESVRENGIREPCLGKDRENSKGEVEIYAGFRRLAAAELAGLTEIPVMVSKRRDLTRQEMFVRNVTENIHRDNLNPVDEAMAYHRMQAEHGMSIEEVCKVLGKSKASVQAKMKLLKLQPFVVEALKGQRITITAALEIDRLPKDKQQKYVLVAEDLTGLKLKTLVDRELDRIQKKLDGVDGKEKPGDKSPVADVTEHVRTIRAASKVVCNGLGYSAAEAQAVREVNYRVLDPDDLRVVAKLLDDCADNVKDEVAVSDGALEELSKAVHDGTRKLLEDSDEFKQRLVRMIVSAAEDRAVEKADGKKPKLTVALMREVLDEFFTQAVK
jgi:ParB family chromosome partitioning protein